MSDLQLRLERFKKRLAKTNDPDECADLTEMIAELEAQIIGAQAVRVQSAPPQPTQTIADNAQVGVVAGIVHGNIYLNGYREQTNAELLAAYLLRLVGKCAALPLEGVYEQRETHDTLSVGLDRVYTQLVTTGTAPYESFTDAELAQFDAPAFLTAHRGADLLPSQLRLGVTALGVKTPRRGAPGGRMLGDAAGADDGIPLDQLDAAALTQLATKATTLTFMGPELVTHAIAIYQHLVLLGEPGSGKSTALRYLALTLAHTCLHRDDTLNKLEGWGVTGRRIPVFMPLLPLAKHFVQHPQRSGDAEDLWNTIAAHLQPAGANLGLAAALHEELERGNVILLLDGLDEVAGADSRRKVVRAVRLFAEDHPNCRIVVACRIRAYAGERNQAWQLPGWPTATLADLTLPQMAWFVQEWYSVVAPLRGRDPQWRDDRIKALLRALTTKDELQRLGRQPLMLTIMALVHLNDGRLPEERVTLYSRCVDILISQWELAKEATEYSTLMRYIGLPDADALTLRRLLARAAAEAHRAAKVGEIGRLSRPVLHMLVAKELENRKHPDPYRGAEKFLVYTDLRAGLIQASDAGDDYTFPHQTFQEYLAGVDLVDGADAVKAIMACRNDDRWRRPIMLGIAHLALNSLYVPHHLLAHLIDAPRRDATQHLFDLLLAAELGSDVGWAWLIERDALFEPLRERLGAALAQFVTGNAVPAAERVQAGVVLGQIGDRRDGVCSLPPALVAFAGGNVSIGNTAAELERIVAEEQGTPYAKNARDWYEDTVTEASVRLEPFALARYPITNAQYALFIAAAGYNPDAPWWNTAGRAWLTQDKRSAPPYWNHERFGQSLPNHPIVTVTWYEATAFCRWLTQHLNDGYVYRLPSEAEWEYAARGAARRTYAWGNEPPADERTNYNGQYGGTSAVGCFPLGATPEGLLDMTGNVWEWTRSAYRPYPYDPRDGREEGADPTKKRFTLRGGSWSDQPINLRASVRSAFAPGGRDDGVGFRVSRYPQV